MYVLRAINEAADVENQTGRRGERGAGVVEWLGISALSIGLLVAVFGALEGVGLDLVSMIRASLGL